jgi:LuxR family maltose regulon positive regulatory protein
VRRPRLLAALERSRGSPLTLVSAPAGTGKTTLVAEWARRLVLRAPVGWVTFEDGDGSLWLDLVSCLDHLGVAVPDLPADSGAYAAPSRAQLTDLAAGIAAAPRRLTVVLDGYELTGRGEARALHQLLERSEGRLGLVLVTRLDPVLPLSRYRLDGSLVEVRMADLAFTDAEAAALLHGSGVDLEPPAVHAVNERVRGWAAGLRFAARALQVHEDPAGPAVSAVEQATDTIEYLLEEVLDVQTSEVRRFLLETSVADMLTTPLVVELCGPGAEHLLAGLPHLNTFAEPVPGQPGCFRYPPFFKALLQAQLAYEQPQRWLELHRRAAQWCLHEGLPDRALNHLSAIHAWREAARLLVSSGRVGPLLSEGALAGASWVVATRIPRDVSIPEACVVRAAVALADGDAHLCTVELAGARARMAVTGAPEGSAPALEAALAVVEAVCAGLSGSAQDAEHLAAAAAATLERARLTTPAVGSTGLVSLVGRCRGLAALRRGDTRTARTHLLQALTPTAPPARTEPRAATTSAPSADEVSAGLRADILGHLAVVDVVEGHLARAARTAEAALALADGARPGSVCHGEAAAHVALAAVALERCHPKDARHQVSTALTEAAMRAHPVCRALAEAALAGVERAAGDLPRALERLDTAAEAAGTADPWLADTLRIETARLGLASGRTDVTAHALGSLADPDAPEAAAVAATALVEQGRYAAAESRLALLRHPAAGPRSEVMGLLAEGARNLHDSAPGRARAALDRSLRLAAPEGLRRPFRDAGPAVRQLLRDKPALLLEHPWLGPGITAGAPAHHPAAAPATERLLEELTAKELEVLRHLAELLTTEEIAGRMFISVNTVRTHVRNVLRKLDVNRRNAAVRRARELGLLPDPLTAPTTEAKGKAVQRPADAS